MQSNVKQSGDYGELILLEHKNIFSGSTWADAMDWRKVTEDDLVCHEKELGLTYKTRESLKGSHGYVIKSSFSFSGPVARFKVDLMENKIGSKD